MRDLLDELAERLEAEAVDGHPDLIVGDVSAERARAALEGLVETGLIVPGYRVEELVEQRTQERLKALKQERGIPA